jgi:hypothetical protein
MGRNAKTWPITHSGASCSSRKLALRGERFDINMLVILGGQERTAAEYGTLLNNGRAYLDADSSNLIAHELDRGGKKTLAKSRAASLRVGRRERGPRKES